MSAAALAQALRDAGIDVREDPGWTRRGRHWQDRWLLRGKPIGVMHHHTSIPVPYPVNGLNGSRDGRIKCNINTKPDGTLWLVAYGACNYSSGPGLSDIRDRVVAEGLVPVANARELGYTRADDDTDGNPLFFNFENDHPGDGSPMPRAQSEVIPLATAVVLEYFDLAVDNVISHAEWTARKHDPYWNTNRRVIETIRAETEELMLNAHERQTVKLMHKAWTRSRTGSVEDEQLRIILRSRSANDGPSEELIREIAREVVDGARVVPAE